MMSFATWFLATPLFYLLSPAPLPSKEGHLNFAKDKM